MRIIPIWSGRLILRANTSLALNGKSSGFLSKFPFSSLYSGSPEVCLNWNTSTVYSIWLPQHYHISTSLLWWYQIQLLCHRWTFKHMLLTLNLLLTTWTAHNTSEIVKTPCLRILLRPLNSIPNTSTRLKKLAVITIMKKWPPKKLFKSCFLDLKVQTRYSETKKKLMHTSEITWLQNFLWMAHS